MPRTDLPPKPFGQTVTWTNNTEVSVTDSSTTLLAANSNRKSLLITNTNTTADLAIRLDLTGGTAATNKGPMIVSKGGSLFLGSNECPTSAITAIRTGATSQLVSADEAT